MKNITEIMGKLKYYNHRVIETPDKEHLNSCCALKWRDAFVEMDYTPAQFATCQKQGFDKLYIFDVEYDDHTWLTNQLVGVKSDKNITTLTHFDKEGKVLWTMTFERIVEKGEGLK